MKKEGKKEGKERGREEGREEGREDGQQGVLKNRKRSKIYILLVPGDLYKSSMSFNV